MRPLLSLLLPCLILLSVPSFSQPAHRHVERLLLGLRFSEAETAIQQLPSPCYQAFYRSNLFLYRAMSTMDPAAIAAFKQPWDQWQSLVQALPAQDSLREMMLADMAAKRTIVELLDHHYLNAAVYARQARRNLDQSKARIGVSVEQHKLEGLFEIMLGSLPERFQWVAQPLGLVGDVEKGWKLLLSAANQATMFNGEAHLLLALVEKNVLNRPEEALIRLEKYRQRLSEPAILVDFFLAAGFQSIKRNEESLALLRNTAPYTSRGAALLPFWSYMEARALYVKGDYPSAATVFERFLSQYRGSLFQTDATFRLGMAHTLAGNPERGRQWFLRMTEDPDRFDEDAYAAAMARHFAAQAPGPVVLALFRARNAFDGGYLDKAEAILSEVKATYALRPAEYVEWHYRRARIRHSRGLLPEAQKEYLAALRYDASGYTSWIHPYSAFYLGEIDASWDNQPAARGWYTKALAYDQYFYQSGLENRCKAALARLERQRHQASSSRP